MPEKTINATPIPPVAPQTPPVVKPAGETEDTRTIVTILLLIFVYPVGFALMWFWAKWKKSIKALVTCITCLPILIAIIFFFGSILLVAINPKEALNRANQMQQQQLQNSEQNLPLNNGTTLPEPVLPSSDTNVPSY
ncbi:MAG: hypothetical protein NT141_02930 [candidate division WWE3 bacterium]|nr:hypothetical protein [candidate division WWE3 bacterium]